MNCITCVGTLEGTNTDAHTHTQSQNITQVANNRKHEQKNAECLAAWLLEGVKYIS